MPTAYYSLNEYCRSRFGHKLYKLSLDGGMTCPNRDGRLDTRGCIFCSAGGSGDFAAHGEDITAQLQEARTRIRKKLPSKDDCGFIAYFQAYTNTYAPVSYLRRIYTEALAFPGVEVLSIATRPDCLPPEVLDLLGELARDHVIWVELGLQTIHEGTAAYIRRGYDMDCFRTAVRELRAREIDVIVHTILGLPGETEDMILATMDELAATDIQGIKLQLLHVLRGTDLAADYAAGRFTLQEMEDYLQLVCRCLEHLPPDLVIHRLTGDGPRALLIAPTWTTDKKRVMNTLQRMLKEQNIRQGSFISER